MKGDGSRKFGKFLPEPVPHLLGIPLTKTLLGTPRESTGSFAAPVRRLKDGGYGIIARKGKESLPFLLSGTISTIPASTPLALTFNDTIVSLTRAEGDMFQFLIPEEAYENEVSRARLFAISGGGTTLHEIALLP